jgi:hypothetical protein
MNKLSIIIIALLTLGVSQVVSADIVSTENYYTETTSGLQIVRTTGQKYSTVEGYMASGYYDSNYGTGGGWRMGTLDDANAIINGMFGQISTLTLGNSADNDPLKPLLNVLGRNKYSSYWRGGQIYLSFITSNDDGTYGNSLMWYIQGSGVRSPGQNVTYSYGNQSSSSVNSSTDYYAPLLVRDTALSLSGGANATSVSAPITMGASMLALFGLFSMRKKKA